MNRWERNLNPDSNE